MKYLPIKRSDLKGEYDLTVDISKTVSFKRFWKKIGNKVYEYMKIGNEEWEERLTPYEMEPFIYFSDKGNE